eukprot:9489923-Pyramimonas_sp.AAC.1
MKRLGGCFPRWRTFKGVGGCLPFIRREVVCAALAKVALNFEMVVSDWDCASAMASGETEPSFAKSCTAAWSWAVRPSSVS